MVLLTLTYQSPEEEERRIEDGTLKQKYYYIYRNHDGVQAAEPELELVKDTRARISVEKHLPTFAGAQAIVDKSTAPVALAPFGSNGNQQCGHIKQ